MKNIAINICILLPSFLIVTLLGVGIYKFNENLTIIDIVLNSILPFILYLFFYRKIGKNIGLLNMVIFSSFCLYLVFLFNYTIFYIPFLDIELSINTNAFNGINYIPGKSILNFSMLKHNIDNILLLIPLGIFLPVLLSKRSLIPLILQCFIIMVIIELAQFIFTNLFSYEKVNYQRVADIDDIILNVVGCSIGYLVYCLIQASKGK